MRRLAIANRHPRLRIGRPSLAAAIAALDAEGARFRGGCPPGELSLVFLTDPALAGLHGRFLGDPSATDVITFPGHPHLAQAGEICVSADAAVRQAGARGAEPGEELALYVVHGWLHLAGFDDLTPAAKRAMRRAEARAIRLLRRKGALPRFAVRGFSVPSRAVRA